MRKPLSINIDFSEVVAEFSLSQPQIDNMASTVVSDLTELIFLRWRAEAKALGSSRNQYRESLVVIDRGRFKNLIVLNGAVPNMIENGASAFDMKEHFKASSKRKIKKDGGWYITIPYRFAAAGSIGENEAFTGGILPKIVHKAVKQLQAKRTSVSGQTISSAQPLINVPAPFDIPKTTAGTEISAPYTHKSSIYKGVTKQTKVYEKAEQSQYVSFRRASDKSDPNSWIHPGITARNFAEKALQGADIDTQVNNSIDSFLSQI